MNDIINDEKLEEFIEDNISIDIDEIELVEIPDVEENLVSAGGEEEFSLIQEHFDEEKQEEFLWKERTGLNDDTLSGAIETVIFMHDKPVAITKIRDHIDSEIPLKYIHSALEKLQDEYEKSHHGIRLSEVANGYQFRTKATYSKYVQNVFKVSSLMLTPSALEVLAIIAYKQPVSRNDIDSIRGVDSSHIVRVLMDKRLVKIIGKSEDLGRPTVYGTTNEFLEVFNLSDITELPSESELSEIAEKDSVGKISDIKTLVGQTEKGKFFHDELDELDVLSKSIRSIKANTPFTKSLRVEDRKRTDVEGNKVKSAFDILEDFIVEREIKDQNKDAINSEILMEGEEINIVEDFSRTDLNAPKPEEEEEVFEMIDLDTGEAIVDEEKEEREEGEEQNADNEIDCLFSELEGEKTLSDELDDAFSNLLQKGSDFSEPLDDLTESSEDDIVFKNQKIDQVTQNLIKDAKDLDLDLDFLNNQNSEHENATEIVDTE